MYVQAVQSEWALASKLALRVPLNLLRMLVANIL